MDVLYSDATSFVVILATSVLPEQGASTSRITAAQVLDTISRLPLMRKISDRRCECTGAVRMKFAPELLRHPEASCPMTRIRANVLRPTQKENKKNTTDNIIVTLVDRAVVQRVCSVSGRVDKRRETLSLEIMSRQAWMSRISKKKCTLKHAVELYTLRNKRRRESDSYLTGRATRTIDKNQQRRKIRVEFTHASSARFFDRVQH